jgi:hypothetical protein
VRFHERRWGQKGRTKNPVRAMRSASRRIKERKGHIRMGEANGQRDRITEGEGGDEIRDGSV